jgi:predicted N-acyltransferase
VESITEIDTAEWNRLAGHVGVYQSHQWLRTLEGDNGTTSWYITVRGHDGTLLAGLPVHLTPHETADAYRADRLFAGLPGAWHEPGVVVGSQRGYQNRLVLAPGAGTEVVTALIETVGALAAEARVPAAYCFYATTETAELLVRSRPGAVPALTNMEAVLTLPGSEFDDYLALFGGRNVRKEMRKFASAGYEITEERLADTWQEIAPIRANVDRRYGREWTDAAMTELMRRYADSMDAISTVYGCRLGGDLVACCVFHEWGDTVYLRMVGFDYERLCDAREYFNLMFYLPAQHAYATGKRHLHYGIGSHRAKVLRKAALHPLWTVNLAADAPPEPVHAWNERHFARWRSEFADCPWAFPPGDQPTPYAG